MESRQRSSHPFAVAIVLVLATVVGTVAIGSIWANRQLLDTGSWVSVSGRMLESKQLRHRVAVFLGEELVGETEAQLGAAGENEVAAEVVPRLRRQSTSLAERAMRTPRFKAVWLGANRTAHKALLRVLDDEGNAQVVAVNLTPELRQLAATLDDSPLADELGPLSLSEFVEPGAGRIKILEADELNRAQDVVKTIRHVPVPAVIAFLALIGLALLLGRSRPSSAFFVVGLALIATGALALAVRALAGHEIVDQLLTAEADREAANAAWRIATSTVVDLAIGAIGLGVLTALFAFLAGGSGAAAGARRALAPAVRTPLACAWTALAAVLVFLVLIVWAPIAAFDTQIGIVVFALVFAGGALVLGRIAWLEDDWA